MLGLSPQPDVLNGWRPKPGFKGRGLLDRPLYLLPRSRLDYRQLEPYDVPTPLAQRFERDVSDLINVKLRDDVDPPVPHTLTLSAEARVLWKAFLRQIEAATMAAGRKATRVNANGKVAGGMTNSTPAVAGVVEGEG